MLLQALHRYAQGRRLLERLAFQRRTIHLLVPLTREGELEGDGLVLLTNPVVSGTKTRTEPGRELLHTRFPGENNGGKAYYLADSYAAVFGVRRDTLAPLPAAARDRKDRNPVEAHKHFWERISAAHARLGDPRL